MKNFVPRVELLALMRELYYRNTALRLENMRLTAEVEAAARELQRWIEISRDSQRLAADWETTALAAIAKAQALEKR